MTPSPEPAALAALREAESEMARVYKMLQSLAPRQACGETALVALDRIRVALGRIDAALAASAGEAGR